MHSANLLRRFRELRKGERKYIRSALHGDDIDGKEEEDSLRNAQRLPTSLDRVPYVLPS